MPIDILIRLVLQVGPGAPVSSLLWDFALLDMGLRVWREKLMLALHIKRLNEDTLARKVYEEQKANKWPGLVEETQKICEILSIENVHTTKLSKKVYRKIITEACHKENEKRLRDKMQGKKKCDRINKERYGKKEYLKNKDIQSARQLYRTRFGMQPFAGNYSHDRRFARTEWLCQCREAREEESHLLSGNCPVYGEIWAKFNNLDDDDSLVKFFNEVLSLRDELEANDI